MPIDPEDAEWNEMLQAHLEGKAPDEFVFTARQGKPKATRLPKCQIQAHEVSASPSADWKAKSRKKERGKFTGIPPRKLFCDFFNRYLEYFIIVGQTPILFN